MPASILLYTNDTGAARREIADKGGRTTHLLGSGALIAILPAGLDPSTLTASSPLRPAFLSVDVAALADGWLMMQRRRAEDVAPKVLVEDRTPLAEKALNTKPVPAPDPRRLKLKPDTPPKDPLAPAAPRVNMKADRHDGLPWDHSDRQPPRSPANDPRLPAGYQAQTAAELAGVPSNGCLSGTIVVGLVVVNSTIPTYAINSTQHTQICSEVLEGSDFLATSDPNAAIQFNVVNSYPTVDVPPGGLSLWQSSLPDCGRDVTNVISDGDAAFAGCHGYVYKVDPTSGEVLVTKSLSGLGRGEVRLAAANGKLYVGLSGYVVALHEADLSIHWQTSLPASSNAVTSVLIDGDFIFAGSNGYVYKLDPASGGVLATNSLSGMGHHEVRLAADGGTLYVGMNGYALGLSQSTMATLWTTSLPGCGYTLTNVLSSGGSVYAGCNGYVYRLDPGAGTVLATNNLSGRGHNEVRLAAGSGYLYIGTNGYALGLGASDLVTRWQVSLPGCGYHPTSVIFQNYQLLAGCNGYVYELDTDSGAIFYTNALAGTLQADTRFGARVGSDTSGVLVGTNGFVTTSYVGSPYEAYEAPWRQAALAALGYPTTDAYLSALMAQTPGATGGYITYFTQYPLEHPGYQYAGTTVVIQYDNDGWGPANINATFAHESCHIFGAQDEYGNCYCGGRFGRAGVPNNNCVNCSGTHVPCLMNQNSLTLCQWTRGQIGWDYCVQEWKTSLPGCGYATTSVVMQGGMEFAGCNGYVYKLDPSSGAVLATNNLSGEGYNQVRLAAANGRIYVGTNGSVLALKASDLSTLWHTDLPDCGNHVTSVVTDGTAVFAGCNGYVYRLDPASGAVRATNGLSGLGHHEVRLAVADGSLCVGTNGYTLGLSYNTLSTSWQTTLPGCGYDITNVSATTGKIYAGCNGYVYRLDPSSGTVLATNALPGLGRNRVGLAIAGDTLFIGCNGYALSLDGNNLTTRWQTSLPGCGYNITNVIVEGSLFYAGCNGYVYKLASDGTVTCKNSMSGTGNAEVQLAADGDQMLVGTNGYAVGILVSPGLYTGTSTSFATAAAACC